MKKNEIKTITIPTINYDEKSNCFKGKVVALPTNLRDKDVSAFTKDVIAYSHKDNLYSFDDKIAKLVDKIERLSTRDVVLKDDVEKAEAELKALYDLKEMYKKSVDVEILKTNISDIPKFAKYFVYITKGSNLGFINAFNVSKSCMTYYNDFFDKTENHDKEKAELKKIIVDFVNEKCDSLGYDVKFKLDRISDDTLRDILSSAFKGLSYSKNGVSKSGKGYTITTKNIENMEKIFVKHILLHTFAQKLKIAETKEKGRVYMDVV